MHSLAGLAELLSVEDVALNELHGGVVLEDGVVLEGLEEVYVVGDDTGLEIDALNGEPGIKSVLAY
ncbi:dITP/XTP pyrophosphatase [Balamuthia mandrillaris]